MSQNVAPWLDGLDGMQTWNFKPAIIPAQNPSSATHDASALGHGTSRIPRRSLSGLPSSLNSHKTSSRPSTTKARSPLAPLNHNDANSMRRAYGTTKLAGPRSVSEASDSSVMIHATVAQRAKSVSPTKQQETLEWKRRLVRGQLGYGDQTDLFGPSPLENMFAKPADDQENSMPRPKNRMSWMQGPQQQMPSSPPPWPSSEAEQPWSDDVGDMEEDHSLESVQEEEHTQMSGTHTVGGDEGSFRSNPFDLQDSEHSEVYNANLETSKNNSSMDRAFVEPSPEKAATKRTVSNLTELEQEDFSLVYVSKHTSDNGRTNYAAIDSHTIKQFQSMDVRLGHPSIRRREPLEFDAEEADRSTFTDGPESESTPPVQDLSLSENLPTGTPDPISLGRHVELKRGGYSQIGSFKQRPLSPSQPALDATNDPDASGMLTVPQGYEMHLPPAPMAPQALSTPMRPRTPSPEKTRSSGSPLKLFGPHDTFTNNRLLRRMSTLDPETFGQDEYAANSSPQAGGIADMQVNQSGRKPSSRASFGDGELDEHTFNAEITITSASDSSKDDSDRSPGSEIPPPGSRTPLGFNFDPSPDVTDTYKLKRKLSKHSAATSKASTLEKPAHSEHLQAAVEHAAEASQHLDQAVAEVKRYADGKRAPTSPFKNPTPKRRRTLHASELEDEVLEANRSYHSQLQEVISSRKGKDSRNVDHHSFAEPGVLASRKILRPRNPTPSQRRQQQVEAEIKEATEEFMIHEPERLEAVMEQIESSMASGNPPTLKEQAQAVASEVAAFTLKVRKASAEKGPRKPSVTTADYLNEAQMVMRFIREKSRPQSGLGSVQESDAENGFDGGASAGLGQHLRIDGTVEDGSSLLRVSRPPSREGRPGLAWRPRSQLQIDARVVSHLRRFQEKDDTEFIADSLNSLHIEDAEGHDKPPLMVVDEESNIRITGPPSERYRRRSDSDASESPVSQRSDGATLHTQSSTHSAGMSTDRTTGTTSTKKSSDNVGTLAPDAVAHLIGEEVGGMTFDKDKQRWVRLKSPEKKQSEFLELPSHLTSDDDPFREISDLPVDEQLEVRRISSPRKPTEMPLAASRSISAHDQVSEVEQQQPSVESRVSSQDTVVARPVTRDCNHIHHAHSSSLPSRHTFFASSQQEQVDTRATSWSNEELAQMAAFGKATTQPLAYAAAQAVLSTRLEQSVLLQQSSTLVLEGTFTFPSPKGHRLPGSVATFEANEAATAGTDDQSETDVVEDPQDDTALDLANSDVEYIASPKQRQTPSKSPRLPASTYGEGARQTSLRNQTLRHRLASQCQDQSELSFIAALPGNRVMSLCLRPLYQRRQQGQVIEQRSSPIKDDQSFLLSDLPDFTVHEVDEERPSERALASRLAHHAAVEVNDRYALAVKDLVKTLTDVHEDEPYWGDLKHLDLQQKSLVSLYGLDDFCIGIQDMNISKNALTRLDGAPATIRRLVARTNQLNSLTCWGHLANLQYLDISNNHLDNLDGLRNLIHLRELRADDNCVTDLEGILELDGLLKLSVRRNKLQSADFEGCQLVRLTSLDLSSNMLTSVRALEYLPALFDLILDGNDLHAGLGLQQQMLQLRRLSMKACHLVDLDVRMLGGLRQLDLDDNRLSVVNGVSSLKDLDILSIRNQALPEGTLLNIFSQPVEARVIKLSENVLPSLQVEHCFLNVQHLELASVGLQDLPADFGLKMPNLRTLNLNFNALRDIRPLLNIQRLEHLYVCGNKLARLRKSVATLAKMRCLRSLDLRDNPITHGFYAALSSVTITQKSLVHIDPRTSYAEDEDESAESMRKAKYELPRRMDVLDKQHLARFDEETKLRRRVYELLLANSCRLVQFLDGLMFDRATCTSKDRVWERLVELGIMRKSGDCNTDSVSPQSQ